MKRIALGILAGAIIAIPAGFAVASGSADDEQAPFVAATDCPQALEAVVAAGYPAPDTFSPDCPDPSSITPNVSEIPILDKAAACEKYEAKPGWCPSPAEIAAASEEGQ